MKKKNPWMVKYDRKYAGLYGLFMQRDLVMLSLSNDLGKTEMGIGFQVDCWRYIFPRDFSKKEFIRRLLGHGLDNLQVSMAMASLDSLRRMVDEITHKTNTKTKVDK